MRAPADKKARETLERALLVHARQEHTTSGKHVTVLTTWERWAQDQTRAAASTMTVDEARAMFGGLL